jgi:hypothetical protein
MMLNKYSYPWQALTLVTGVRGKSKFVSTEVLETALFASDKGDCCRLLDFISSCKANPVDYLSIMLINLEKGVNTNFIAE